jgi:FkbH-like protein
MITKISEHPDYLTALQSPTATAIEIQTTLNSLDTLGYFNRELAVGISSNITIDRIALYIKKYSAIYRIKSHIEIGNYDSLLDDIQRFKSINVEYFLYLPFFDNLLPSFEAQIYSGLSDDIIDTKLEEYRNLLTLAFKEASAFKQIFVVTFHRHSALSYYGDPDVIDQVIEKFNNTLISIAKKYQNSIIINSDNIIATLGINNIFDYRFYFQSKAPYASLFFDKISSIILSSTKAFSSYFIKAIIVDCDNTLWGGIIGEDLINGVQLSKFDFPGNIYWRIQHLLLGLERRGILLCLCSKNNLSDVDAMIDGHPDMIIKHKNIAIKKINWNDKVHNIREISQELNIGLDSLIFLDDSDFECQAVKTQLPMVKTFQVPKKLSSYENLLNKIIQSVDKNQKSNEAVAQTEKYRMIAAAKSTEASYDTQEEYLASLDLKVEISRNNITSIPRISELSLKSNQFNLTTIRYSEGEIFNLMHDSEASVYSLVVTDKFGSAGLTGVVIVKFVANIMEIESFFMSCRVIGRGVEFSFWDTIVADGLTKNCSKLVATYRQSDRNAQVENFYDQLGLFEENNDPHLKSYSADLNSIAFPTKKWIEVKNVR